MHLQAWQSLIIAYLKFSPQFGIVPTRQAHLLHKEDALKTQEIIRKIV